MTGWIIYNKKDAKRNAAYIDLNIEEGKKQGINISLLYAEDIQFGIKENKVIIFYQMKSLIVPDFAIMRMNYPLLSKQLEELNIPTFNCSTVAEICNDKAKTYQYVSKLGLPMVESLFVHKDFVKETMIAWKRPYVIKAVSGHGGSQVFLITENTSEDELSEVYSKLDDHVVIQPLTGTRHQDLRVYVVGGEIIAAVLRTAKEGFKSNFSLGGNVELYELSNKEKADIEKIISLFDFSLAGIDFIIGEQGELIFNEIEDVVGSRMLYRSSDINIVALHLAYIKKCVHK